MNFCMLENLYFKIPHTCKEREGPGIVVVTVTTREKASEWIYLKLISEMQQHIGGAASLVRTRSTCLFDQPCLVEPFSPANPVYPKCRSLVDEMKKLADLESPAWSFANAHIAESYWARGEAIMARGAASSR